MIFSPITERSTRVRVFYAILYLLLSLGAVTIVMPLLIMLTGSVEPGSRSTASRFIPTYLFNDNALWERYVIAKYRNTQDFVRMAWGDATIEMSRPKWHSGEDPMIPLWEEFLKTEKPSEDNFYVGFTTSKTGPAYNNYRFQQFLLDNYGNVEGINKALATSFARSQSILPPNILISGAELGRTTLQMEFFRFSETQVPSSQKFVWDAGGFYRNVFLPRVLGAIDKFNEKYGTQYKSYSEVPFSETVPPVASDMWFTFVSRVLRPDFIDLTEQGKAHMAEAKMPKGEFIRMAAKPEDLKVVSLDRRFINWAKENHGVENAYIPQHALDVKAFKESRGFWKKVFLTQNYSYVLDAILFEGHAFKNTVVLVILMVAGALLINPLAAYALSRFKLSKTYYILLFFMATMAFPAEVTMIPVFLQLKEFNLLNTYGALVLPSLANGFSIFLLKGFFDSLPKELYEAAELDGASEWKMFWLIAMNLSKPILAVKALGAFVSAYSAFFFALILAPDPKMWTIMVYVYQLQQTVETPVVYASLIITAIPTLLVFIFCQNIILRGIVVPSEK